jgi:hypothetical protein
LQSFYYLTMCTIYIPSRFYNFQASLNQRANMYLLLKVNKMSILSCVHKNGWGTIFSCKLDLPTSWANVMKIIFAIYFALWGIKIGNFLAHTKELPIVIMSWFYVDCIILCNYQFSDIFGQIKPYVTLSSGLDVMITIFCEFWQFSAKIGVFLKKQCYDQIF